MPALPDNLHRGRYLLLLVGLFVVLFVAGMMTLGALGAAGATLFWGRAGVTVVSLAVASLLAQAAARRGRPRWLLRTPPTTPPE